MASYGSGAYGLGAYGAGDPPLAVPQISPSTLRTVYLGAPGSMTRLVVPDAGVTYPLTRGASITTLISGGSSRVSTRRTRRAYGFAFSHRTQDELDPILGFYAGLRGEGPFCLIDPGWRNLMGMDVSTFGRQLQAVSGWSVAASGAISASSVAYSSTISPAGGNPNSGVAAWVAGGAGQLLFEGANDLTRGNSARGWLVPDVDIATRSGTAVPYVPSLPHLISVWVMSLVANQRIRLGAIGLPSTGASVTAIPATSWSPTTTLAAGVWTPLTALVTPGASGFSAAATPYLCAALQKVDASSNIVYASCAMHQAGVSTADAWVTGLGVPRLILDDENAAGNPVAWARQSQTLVLKET